MSWVNDEAKTASFGDARLDERMDKVLGGLAEDPGASIPQALGGWAETQAAYRFFDNDKVTFEKVLEPHSNATLERIRTQPVVLLPQDTTDCIRVVNKGAMGMGTFRIPDSGNEPRTAYLLNNMGVSLNNLRICLDFRSENNMVRILTR
jgi:hypothetical protein